MTTNSATFIQFNNNILCLSLNDFTIHNKLHKKVQLFLKNPLDKWAPRAIMQPTSEELQTYDGEK